MRKDVGVDGDAQRIGQLVWMLFLKIFDDQEQEWELSEDHYRSPIPEALRWRNWAANAEGITGDALSSSSTTSSSRLSRTSPKAARSTSAGWSFARVFEDAYNYMKNGTLLRQVINKIKDEHRLQRLEAPPPVRRHLRADPPRPAERGQCRRVLHAPRRHPVHRRSGQPAARRDVSRPRLRHRRLPRLRHRAHPQAGREDRRRTSRRCKPAIFGVEKKPLPHLLCVTNMLLHGIDVPELIRHDNTLARPLRDYGPKDRVDVVVTNPPFGGMEEDGIETNFPRAFRTRETADLFLVLIMHLLKPGGRAGIVLPDGTLFGEGVKTRIKEKLLDECNLHTIVRLPNGVFSPYTGIKTNLLFFTKGEPTKSLVLRAPLSARATSPTRRPSRSASRSSSPRRSGGPSARRTNTPGRYSVEQIKASGYNLDIKNPHDAGTGHTDPAELLADYQKLLAELQQTRDRLKNELRTALERSAS